MQKSEEDVTYPSILPSAYSFEVEFLPKLRTCTSRLGWKPVSPRDPPISTSLRVEVTGMHATFGLLCEFSDPNPVLMIGKQALLTVELSLQHHLLSHPPTSASWNCLSN